MRHVVKRGAILGFLAGLVVLVGTLVVAAHCLPFRISLPPQPWPWYCSDPAYSAVGYLAFPVNLLTNDLSLAIRLAPLSLLIYAILGSLLGLLFGWSRPSPPDI